MAKLEFGLSIKQKMNMEQKSVMELLDKLLFLKMTDEEKFKHLEYIKSCRLKYLELEKELLLEKQSKNKKIQKWLYKLKGR